MDARQTDGAPRSRYAAAGALAGQGPALLLARVALACTFAICLSAYVSTAGPSGRMLRATAQRATRLTGGQGAVTPDQYASVCLALGVVVVVVFTAIAVLIVTRRSDEAPALLAAATLVAFGVAVPGAAQAIATGVPIWAALLGPVQALGWALLLILAFVFPDGRWLPRWTLWLVPLWVAWVVVFFVYGGVLIGPHAVWIGISFTGWVAWFAVGVLARGIRYVRIAGVAERQQTKWVALGGFGAIVGVLAAAIPSVAALSLARPAGADLAYQLIAYGVCACTSLLIPLTIAIAILRHRLFDIDLIINRTLVYGAVSLLLAAIYFASVVVLQLLAHRLTNSTAESPFVVTLSTLLIAALFQPARARLQRLVDRRFYRGKYDAVRTVEAFATSLSTELELAELHEQLLAVVRRTMQPHGASLWLARSPDRGEDWSAERRRDAPPRAGGK